MLVQWELDTLDRPVVAVLDSLVQWALWDQLDLQAVLDSLDRLGLQAVLDLLDQLALWDQLAL